VIVPPGGKAESVSVSLYDFNVHKMQDSWQGWISHIRETNLAPPDIVLLQDVENDAGRGVFQAALTKSFGGAWQGRSSHREWQTAIVWRSDRFVRPTSRLWQGFGGEACRDGSQDAPAIQVRLFDSRAKKWISLVSLKTPPQVDDECVLSNFRKVNNNFKPPWTGDLYVIGTDANAPDRDDAGEWMTWYRKSVRSKAGGLLDADSLKFCDPILEACKADKGILDEGHLTLRDIRIDFLLLRLASGRNPTITRSLTLPRGKPAKWSDHRSVHVEVQY
jgi:hypothetical protein